MSWVLLSGHENQLPIAVHERSAQRLLNGCNPNCRVPVLHDAGTRKYHRMPQQQQA